MASTNNEAGIDTLHIILPDASRHIELETVAGETADRLARRVGNAEGIGEGWKEYGVCSAANEDGIGLVDGPGLWPVVARQGKGWWTEAEIKGFSLSEFAF